MPLPEYYAFLRLYYTAFALQSSRTEGVRTESKQAQLPFIGRSSFVPLWLRPVFPGSSTSFLTESAYFSHSFQYYDYSRSCRSLFQLLLHFHAQNSRHISRPPRSVRGKKRGKPLIYIAPYVLGASRSSRSDSTRLRLASSRSGFVRPLFGVVRLRLEFWQGLRRRPRLRSCGWCPVWPALRRSCWSWCMPCPPWPFP